MAQAKILIVDDEPMVESLINQRFKNKIKSNEFEFIYCRQGQQALEALKKDQEIELVLIDINMPVMDGFTLLDTLMKQKRTYRIVIVTAYADMTNVRRAISMGAADFITKPIDLDDLETTIIRNLKYLASFKDSERREKQLLAFLKELKGAKTIYPSSDYKKLSQEGIAIHAEVFPETTIEGAFFDVYSWDNRHFGFSIGDVPEEGLPAALMVEMCRSFLKALCIKQQTPSFCLKTLQEAFATKNFTPAFNVFFGVFDSDSSTLTYASIGEILFISVSKEGNVTELYCARDETLNLDSARQGQIEAKASERRSPAPSGQGEEEDQFGKVAASPNLKFYPARSIGATSQDNAIKLSQGESLVLLTKKIKNSLSETYDNRIKDFLKKNAHQFPELMSKGIKNDINLFLGSSPESNLAVFILKVMKGGA